MVARALLTIVLACSMSIAPQRAGAEIAGAGLAIVDFEGSFPSTFFEGQAQFLSQIPEFVVAGQPVDLQGTFPAGATIGEGLLIVDTFSYELSASSSSSGAFLNFFDVSGKTELCTTASCSPPGFDLIGVPSFVQASPGVLPQAPRLYVVDGPVPFGYDGGESTGAGMFGINAFPPHPTSAGSAFIDSGDDVFFDSIKGDVVPYRASVQYHGVIEPGLTYIVPVSAQSGALPAGVTLNTGGLESVFVDIYKLTDIGTLTDGAQGVEEGGVTVCLAVNPGDTPPTVPLDQLVLLHRSSPDGAFIDTGAEVLSDPARLCATVPSLSPFVIGVGEAATTTTTLPPATTTTTLGTTTSTIVQTTTTTSTPATTSTTSTSPTTSIPTSTSTSTSSSTSTSNSSTTSSSTTTSSTTSTTPGCTDAATFASILCRIDLLTAATEAGDIDQRVQETLLARLAKARSVVLEAQERAAAGVERGAQSKLKSAERRMRGYVQRVSSLAGRRGIMDPGLAAVLTDHAEAIEADFKTLRQSL